MQNISKSFKKVKTHLFMEFKNSLNINNAYITCFNITVAFYKLKNNGLIEFNDFQKSLIQ